MQLIGAVKNLPVELTNCGGPDKPDNNISYRG